MNAGPATHFATSLPPRGLSVHAAADYIGTSTRDIWRRVKRGELATVRWPGCRRVVFDIRDLDLLFTDAYKDRPSPPPGSSPVRRAVSPDGRGRGGAGAEAVAERGP